MVRKTRAAASTATAVAVTSSASAGTRSKRKASAISVSVSVAASAGITTTVGVRASTSTSAISPALKKRRAARPHVSAIPFPALYGSKEVINLYDDDDGDDVDSVDVAVSAPSTGELFAPPARLVDPDVHLPAMLAGRMRVVHMGGEVFDAMLTRACMVQQQNEFVLLQALVSDAHDFYVWTRSGFVGTPGETQLNGPWTTVHEAVDQFKSVFLAKTMLYWDERHAHRFDEGCFTWIETHQTMVEEDDASAAVAAAAVEDQAMTTRRRRSTKKSRARPASCKPKPQPLTEILVHKATMPSAISPPPSRLDADVQTFLLMAIDAASSYSTADHRFYSYAVARQPKRTEPVPSDIVLVPIPLGKLSKATIERGFNALHRIHDAIQRKSDHRILTKLSSNFYSLVPHTHLVVIDSMVRLIEKVEMLVALSVHEGHTELLLPDLTRRYFLTNHLDACYDTLECRLFPLLPTSKEFGLVQSYIFNSFCCVGNNYGTEGKVVTVFRVEKPSEASRFHSYRTAPNRRVLWHGSRLSNWMGILKHGLMITPPGVPLNGSSLGAGLYFTDKISKAMAYSHASHDRQVFLLSEVALGQCRPSTTGGRHPTASAAATVHHSCHGVGRCIPDSTGDYEDAFGAIWPLGKATQTKDARATHGHNEFVVFNTAQARMRYLVVTHPLY